MKLVKKSTLLVLLFCLVSIGFAAPLGTAFTYQGHLYDTNNVADGLYDFQFKLYDANSGGNKKGTDINKPDVGVIDGYFTVELDFGSSVFDGNAVWLDIGIRPGVQNDPCEYTNLSPRQEVSPTPYALFALESDSDWIIDGNDMYSGVSGNIGIGTTNPDYMLDIQGSKNSYIGNFENKYNGNTFGIRAKADSSNDTISNALGVYAGALSGSSLGSAYGVQSHALAYGSSTAYGIYSKATSGNTTGKEWAFYGLAPHFQRRTLDTLCPVCEQTVTA